MTASPFAFVDGALDRADHLRDDPDALAALWPRARILLLDDDGRALADESSHLAPVSGAELGAGTATEGQACMFANSCVPGMMCVNPGPTCQEICDTLDDDPGCTIPEVCTAIGDPADADLGVCTE